MISVYSNCWLANNRRAYTYPAFVRYHREVWKEVNGFDDVTMATPTSGCFLWLCDTTEYHCVPVMIYDNHVLEMPEGGINIIQAWDKFTNSLTLVRFLQYGNASTLSTTFICTWHCDSVCWPILIYVKTSKETNKSSTTFIFDQWIYPLRDSCMCQTNPNKTNILTNCTSVQ